MDTPEDRAARQRDIVPPDRLAMCRATVVGVGAIGRQVALQLVAMGVMHLQLIDPDHVEVVNLAPQGYCEGDVGQTKVQATANLCRRLHIGIEIHEHCERFRRSMEVGNVLFNCVDDIEVRRIIWESTQSKLGFYADGRMSAEVIRVLAACDEHSRHHYPTTLFSSAEAFQGACTAKSTIFTANIAAGLMLSQFSKWLRNVPIDKDLMLNLLSTELSIG